MFVVRMTVSAAAQFDAVPPTVYARVRDVFVRLQDWPAVSGAKPMRGALKGSFRVRTGDWRIVFRVVGNEVIVFKIGNRKDVYDG